jgi:hypothetical protein
LQQRCNPKPKQGGFAMTNSKSLDQHILRQFTGSAHWYRHGLVPIITFTDGAKYIADAGGAYWLLDEIALAQRYVKTVVAEEFQVWKLKVNPDSTATLTCEDGNDNAVFSKAIEFTDFPPEGITLWFENNTIYLPSER